jgi:hypothetical protein
MKARPRRCCARSRRPSCWSPCMYYLLPIDRITSVPLGVLLAIGLGWALTVSRSCGLMLRDRGELVGLAPAIRLRALPELLVMLDEVASAAMASAMTPAKDEGWGLRRIGTFAGVSHEQVRRARGFPGGWGGPRAFRRPSSTRPMTRSRFSGTTSSCRATERVT